MGIGDLLKNLTDYNHPDLKYKEINGRKYKTFTIGNAKPKAVFAQAFGASYNADSYNRVLAEMVLDLRNYFNETSKRDLTVIVQTEVGKCLERIYPGHNFYQIGEQYNEEEKSFLKSKIDTYTMLEKTQELLKNLGFENDLGIFIVGHPAHMQRILDTAGKMGFKPIPLIPFMSDNSWFPKNDPQLWVRSKYFWIPREVATRIHYKIKGTI